MMKYERKQIIEMLKKNETVRLHQFSDDVIQFCMDIGLKAFLYPRSDSDGNFKCWITSDGDDWYDFIYKLKYDWEEGKVFKIEKPDRGYRLPLPHDKKYNEPPEPPQPPPVRRIKEGVRILQSSSFND